MTDKVERKASLYDALGLIPRSYGIYDIRDILGMGNVNSFHNSHLAPYIRRYGYRRCPRYDIWDVEEVARRVYWMRELIKRGEYPGKPASYLEALRIDPAPPEGYIEEFLRGFREERAIPPSYLIPGVVKRLGYSDRGSTHRSGLLELIRCYEIGQGRYLYNAADVLIAAQARRDFIDQVKQGKVLASERRGWIFARFREIQSQGLGEEMVESAGQDRVGGREIGEVKGDSVIREEQGNHSS